MPGRGRCRRRGRCWLGAEVACEAVAGGGPCFFASTVASQAVEGGGACSFGPKNGSRRNFCRSGQKRAESRKLHREWPKYGARNPSPARMAEYGAEGAGKPETLTPTPKNSGYDPPGTGWLGAATPPPP